MPIVDGLAKSYAGDPVLFLQYELDSTVSRARHDRFMAAWQLDKSPAEREPATPHTMVDSGQHISYGERDFLVDFRKMIDEEMPRQAGAIIDAVRERPDSRTILLQAQVTNISTTTLQTIENGATLHAVLYEGNRNLHYGTTVHAAQVVQLDEPLEPGQTRLFDLVFDVPRGVNGSLLDVAVLLDYLPPGGNGRWDMLQAAIAQTRELPPSPTPWPSPTPRPTLTPTPAPPTATPTVEPLPVPTDPPPSYRLYLPRALRRWSRPW